MFNNWFTIIVFDGITPTLNKAKRTNVAQPIRSQNGEKKLNTQVLTVDASVHKSNQSEQAAKIQEGKTMAEQRNLANSKISKVYVQANYESDKTIQKGIRLGEDRNASVISRLPSPWSEKFTSFTVDEKGLLFMNQRLVIPKDMRENLLRAIHFGHAVRVAMLREATSTGR